ncbi:hypothetical protein M501DRAFT_660615 [Patellaria atrata CBS 101060]|uniref:Uncharacterized protein n=1 Tax=Patellaria atrata CBS 101060 TaxID=1346257 RepID=A0A9P4SDZ3_9PEZI|nr:hypothetical protein M501DRAFT_660615 [Patellaria atrata CBS 101060]
MGNIHMIEVRSFHKIIYVPQSRAIQTSWLQNLSVGDFCLAYDVQIEYVQDWLRRLCDGFSRFNMTHRIPVPHSTSKGERVKATEFWVVQVPSDALLEGLGGLFGGQWGKSCGPQRAASDPWDGRGFVISRLKLNTSRNLQSGPWALPSSFRSTSHNPFLLNYRDPSYSSPALLIAPSQPFFTHPYLTHFRLHHHLSPKSSDISQLHPTIRLLNSVSYLCYIPTADQLCCFSSLCSEFYHKKVLKHEYHTEFQELPASREAGPRSQLSSRRRHDQCIKRSRSTSEI